MPKRLSPKRKRVVSSGYPADDKTQARHDRIHEAGANDPAVQRYVAESAVNRRRFADVCGELKQSRLKAGLSLADVAARSGINKANLSGLENGKGNPTLDTVERIAAAIGVVITIHVSAA